MKKQIPVMPYKSLRLSLPVAEDIAACVKKFGGQYEMTIAAAKRARKLRAGAKPKVPGNHTPAVTALLEIQAGVLEPEDYL